MSASSPSRRLYSRRPRFAWSTPIFLSGVTTVVAFARKWLGRTEVRSALRCADKGSQQGGYGQGLALEDMERQHICDILEQTNWRVSGEKGAAKILGLNPTTLEARMKKLGIARPSSPTG